MITRDGEEFLRRLAAQPVDRAAAIPRGVFMVLPRQFEVNTESAVDNAYVDLEHPANPARAVVQGEALAGLLESLGVPLVRFQGDERTPDDVFPNNVFGTAPGRFIVGAMHHPSRCPEAGREDIRRHFLDEGRTLYDLSTRDCTAELTGVLVIDRARNVGFCGMSTRVDEPGLEAMHEAFGLTLSYHFDLQPDEYHTNVVLTVLAGRAAILHPAAFADPQVPEVIARAFPDRTLFLDDGEKHAFAANSIAVTDRDVLFSQTALDALHPDKQALLESWGFSLHATPLDEFEKAGGSLRCMLAEIF